MKKPTSAPELFDHYLPLGVAAYPEKVREIGAIFGFKILDGDTALYWVLDCTASPPKVHKDTGPAAQCTIEMQHEDFKKLFQSHRHGLDLYFQNKIHITGQSDLVLKLSTFFDLTFPYPGP